VLCGTVLAALTLPPYPGLVACTVWDVCILFTLLLYHTIRDCQPPKYKIIRMPHIGLAPRMFAVATYS